MGSIASNLLSRLPSLSNTGKLTIAIIHEKYHEELTELIAQLSLRGPFHLIVGGEWLPDQDSLRRAVRRHTTDVAEVLERPILGRPSTCLQLRNQLEEATAQRHPVFILNLFHHFYDPDLDLILRRRVLEDCCRCVNDLASSRPVLVLLRALLVDEYQDFLPSLTSIATEIIEIEEKPNTQAFQPSLL